MLVLLILAAGLAMAAPAARAQVNPSAALADYQAKLAQYLQARQAYDAEADVYWNAVIEKRRVRNAKRRDHIADPSSPTTYSPSRRSIPDRRGRSIL